MARPATYIKPIAEKMCRDFPNASNYALGRMLHAAHKEALTPNAAQLHIRRARGAHGKKNRICAKVAPSKHTQIPQCPPSAAEPWLKVEIDGPCRVLSLSDIHIPYHHREALEAAVAYGRKLKPNVVLINGDYMDFHQLSRWDKDPKNRSTAEEIEIGKQGLKWLRNRYPKARIIYKLGNHCERLNKYVYSRCVELWGLEGLQLHNALDFENLGIERVNDNPIMLGKLPVLHGHEAGKGISAPVNPARGLFLRTLHSCLEGHYHRTSTHCEPDMFKNERTTWSQGCLCDMTPLYARFNKWNWGFAFIDVAKDNEFDMHNLRISDDYKVRTA